MLLKRFVTMLLGIGIYISFMASVAYADEWILPFALQEIEDEAFFGCTQLQEAVLPEGTTTIGERAFKNCAHLCRIELPSSLELIGDQAFEGCAEAFYVLCKPGTPGAEWAVSSGFDWDAGTVCRALIIGQSYGGTDISLQGPVYDMHAVAFCLRQMKTRAYTVIERTNLTAEGILSAIDSTFSNATTNDISFLYYSGHGLEDGSLLGQDKQSVSPSVLRAALDGISGRKVVIVDACYSGALLEDELLQKNASPVRTQKNGLDAFAQCFAAAFYANTRSLKGTSYYVMTSCQAAEKSEEGYIRSGTSGHYMGYFTFALCQGCGWDGIRNQATNRLADQNGDNVVTFSEAYCYAVFQAQENNPKQSAVVYPAQCTWFSPFRP